MTRRQLLKTASGVAGLLALGQQQALGAEPDCMPCPTNTVYHLETDWAEPRGPHHKTRLVSRASRRAAQHRYALNEQDALDMNLHRCSWAPAGETRVCAVEFASLWEQLSYEWESPWLNRQVRVFDIRHVLDIPNGEARLAHALLIATDGAEHCDAQVGGIVGGALPFTGLSLLGSAAVAAGMVVTGLVSLRVSRERASIEASADQ